MNCKNSDLENLKNRVECLEHFDLYIALGAFYRAILNSILLSLVMPKVAVYI